ncbi:Serine/Threonine protein kinases active-site signature [Nakaseomyces glabratus]
MATIPKRHTYGGGPEVHYTRNPYSAAPRNSMSSRGKKHVTFGPYIVGSTLGEGEFGKVKLGWTRTPSTGPEQRPAVSKQVAIKLIRRDTIVKNSEKEIKIYREINALKHLTHPNVVRLEEVLQNSKYIGIVLEYASGGEFYKYIQRKRRLKESTACRLFAQLISGVTYMHSKNLVHRDLKLENLLLDKNENLVITDFGFVNEFLPDNEYMKTSCGSPCYAAPELVISTRPYVARKADVWSCGIILYAMLAGYLPWDDDSTNPEGDDIGKLYQYITRTPLKFPEYITPIPRDLLRKILVPDPNKRVNMQYIHRHEWLKPHRPFLAVSTSQWDKLIKNSANVQLDHTKRVSRTSQHFETEQENSSVNQPVRSDIANKAMDTSNTTDDAQHSIPNRQPLANVFINSRTYSARSASYAPRHSMSDDPNAIESARHAVQNKHESNLATVMGSPNKDKDDTTEDNNLETVARTSSHHRKPRPTSYYPVDINRSANNFSPIVLNLTNSDENDNSKHPYSTSTSNNPVAPTPQRDQSQVVTDEHGLQLEKNRVREQPLTSDKSRMSSLRSNATAKSSDSKKNKRFSLLSFYTNNGSKTSLHNDSKVSVTPSSKEESATVPPSIPSVVHHTDTTENKRNHRASMMGPSAGGDKSTARRVIDFFKRRSMRM